MTVGNARHRGRREDTRRHPQRRNADGPARATRRTDRPGRDAGWGTDRQPRKGFFTDTSICIGCKACEVACKEWNTLPMDGDLSILGMKP